MSARRFAPPRPIAVTARAREGVPLAFRWRGRAERVARVEAAWEVVEGWWRGEPASTRRRYYRLLTRRGLWCVVYRDLASGRWFVEQVID